MSHWIRSKKEGFANLANQVYERELLKILLLYFPTLDISKTKSNSKSSEQITLVKRMAILKNALRLGTNEKLQHHLQAISQFLGCHIKLSECQTQIVRWGKVCLHGKLIYSSLSDNICSVNSLTRYSRWFEVCNIHLIFNQS